MPRINRKRKAYIRSIMADHGVKYDEALRIAEDDDPAWARELMDANGWSYDDVVAWRAAPSNQPLCDDCGWTVGMFCPDCSKGCGCEYRCTGWRHDEMRAATGEYDDRDDDYGCGECGAGSGDDPYGECVCYPEDEDEGQEHEDYAGATA